MFSSTQVSFVLVLLTAAVVVYLRSYGTTPIYEFFSQTLLSNPFSNEFSDSNDSNVITSSDSSRVDGITGMPSGALNSGSSSWFQFIPSVSAMQNGLQILAVNWMRLWSLNPSLSQLLVVSAVVYSIVYSFCPIGADRGSVEGDEPVVIYIGMNDSMTVEEPHDSILDSDSEAGVRKTDSADIDSEELLRRHTAAHVFSLETACILMESSWQTYFRTPKAEKLENTRCFVRTDKKVPVSTASSSSAPMLTEFGLGESRHGGLIGDDDMSSVDDSGAAERDLQQLQLQHVVDVDCAEVDMKCYVAVRPSESLLVVAFRGTNSLNNVATDLSMSQVNLPDLSIPVCEPRVIHEPPPPAMSTHSNDTRNGRRSFLSEYMPLLASRSGRNGANSRSSSEPTTVSSIDDIVCSCVHSRHKFRMGRFDLDSLAPAALDVSSALEQDECAERDTKRGRVHAGFWYAYSHIRRELFRGLVLGALRLLSLRSASSDYKDEELRLQIKLTGHSLGMTTPLLYKILLCSVKNKWCIIT